MLLVATDVFVQIKLRFTASQRSFTEWSCDSNNDMLYITVLCSFITCNCVRRVETKETKMKKKKCLCLYKLNTHKSTASQLHVWCSETHIDIGGLV